MKWVCVSDDSGEGFGANALLKKITKSKNDEGEKTLDDLKNKLHEEISQKKYLLVLDDVWSKESENWEKVRSLLDVGAKGSKIVVTTRNTEVQFMGNNTFRIKLEGLGKDDSWKLFSYITFGEQENTVSPAIIKVGEEIVRMCNGVPLIIKTLGRTLKQFESDLSKWVSIQKNENLLSLPYGNDNVLRVLKLSYDNLPTHLKQCFTYCALFPKDYEIEKKLLVQLWIAQGYIQSTNGNEQLEDIGDQYFKELLSSSLLEEVDKDAFNNTLSCKMHDLIHDLAQSIVGSEVLVLRSDVNNILEEIRHVSLFEKVKPMIKALEGKPIRTFLKLCDRSFGGNTIVNSFLPSFMCLRALSLNKLNLKKVPKCLGKLSHLRYLDLSYNDFKILPNSITRLKNLQTLKLTRCWKLNRIPEKIGELINLRHLENDECDELTHMPREIGKLTLLQSLPLFVVGNDRWWLRNHKVGRLSELKSLNQLRGELCIRNLENVRDLIRVSKEEILKGKQHLQSLLLKWERWDEGGGDEGDELVMEGLQPNSNLRELFIEGYGGRRFPSWMINDGLGSLSQLEINDCPNLTSLGLHSSPSLSQLEITKCHTLTSLELHSSPSLSQLEINDCPDLTSLGLHSSPSLSQLVIRNCRTLTSLELQSSLCLSQLKIVDCPNLTSLGLHSSPSLSQLEIRKCRTLTSLELHSSPSLSQLEINDCPKLTSLELHSSPSLTQLDIRKCSLELLSSHWLSKLKIINCPNLASFNVASLPRLEELSLRGVGAEVLRQFMFVSASSSLKSLCIRDIGGDISLPEELLQYVSTLETLCIVKCSGLSTLLHWMGSLSSLTHLTIYDCTELTSLPEEIYSLKKLQTFDFCDYPDLEKRYNKETGEDRAKIAHIPCIRFCADHMMRFQLDRNF